MHLFQDIWGVLTSFTLVDYILYFSILTLIVLVISLIYVIKTEKIENEKEELNDLQPKRESVSLVEEKEEFDLKNIVGQINENPEPIIDMTAYETEQEQKAIISYDELLSASNQSNINYDKEELVDDVIPVKRIQVGSLELPKMKEVKEEGLAFANLKLTQKEPKFEVDSNVSERKEIKLFSYEKEEAFLKALKELNELLN